MKRVVIFSLGYFPKHVGGAEVAIREIVERIPENKYEFHLVCLRYDSTLPREEKVGPVHVYRIGPTRENPTMSELKRFPLHYNKHLYQFYAAWYAWRLHRKVRFDAAWAMMAHSCGVPVALFHMVTKVPFTLTLQEGDPPEYIERIAKPVWPLFKRAFTRARVVQTISHFLADWARRMGTTAPIEVIPNAVNVAHFAREFQKKEVIEARESLTKNPDAILLITTSRLVHKNGIDDVLNALPLLPERVQFVIYGIGPDEDKLKQLCADLALENRVHFMGQVSHEEMPLALKACDVFIRPSRSEGMGNSFIEAMAAGLPVVATQEGGIADFLFDATRNPENPTTGWAVDANSREDIARAVEDILAHPQKVEEVTSTAHNMVEKKYDWVVIAHDMQKRVFDVVAGIQK